MNLRQFLYGLGGTGQDVHQVRRTINTGRRPPSYSPAQLRYLRTRQRHLSHPPVWPRHPHLPPAIPHLGSTARGRGTPPPPLVTAVAQAVPAVGTLIQAVNTGGQLFADAVNWITGGDDARTIAERQARTQAAYDAVQLQTAQLRADNPNPVAYAAQRQALADSIVGQSLPAAAAPPLEQPIRGRFED